ncbi:MAG: tetratricopeptide repeat protein [Sulfuricellaceae bacterium]
MSWQRWADALRLAPRQAVADLLRGAADVSPFERVAPHEFLLAVLPRNSRNVSPALLGEPRSASAETDASADLPACLDAGLTDWLLAQRLAPLPPAGKLGAYAAQVCEALQWPLYFALPQTRAALQAERALWLAWLGALTLSAYRDPEYDYWQVLAAQQADDQLQSFWQSFVVEAGRTRSARYLNLGLLALAKLPLSEDDSLRNLRLQVQALVNRYQRRTGWGAPALEELALLLRGVVARNPSLNAAHYRTFLSALLAPLGEDKTASVLSMLGMNPAPSAQRPAGANGSAVYKLDPPGLATETDEAVRAVRLSRSLAQAWKVIRPLLVAHEDFLHKSGDAHYFVRTLDMCARALCRKYPLRDPEIQSRLFQWIHLALRVDADDPRRWMLWELALRQAGHPQRAQWVLWEMARRFPDDLACRVELARLLVASRSPDDEVQAHRLLQQVLQLEPDNLHAHSTLAQLAIRRRDWSQALTHAQQGLRIDPGDGTSAVLLATAYAWREAPGDLPAAIDHLQRFVTRYPGQVNAEGYLRTLLQRQQWAAQGRLSTYADDEEPARADRVSPETDPVWRAFAASVRAGADVAAPGAAATLPTDRAPLLPQALQQAVACNQWDADLLERFDEAARREFPLETRLWQYLQTLHASASGERERAKQAMQTWLDAETRAAEQDAPSWAVYLNKRWAALNAAADAALAVGAEWLNDLLDRHRPLPAPLFA